MITLLVGDNEFLLERALARIVADVHEPVEHSDGGEMTREQLSDVLMGVSLFAEKRCVVIRRLSDNKTLWAVLPDWLDRLSDDVSLILVEPHPDKRTKTYKALVKRAQVESFDALSERDTSRAEQWVLGEAGERGIVLTPRLAAHIVSRTGVDFWRMNEALDKVAVFDTVDEATIQKVVDDSPEESVFAVFEAALRGDTARIADMFATLRRSEDPYRLFGLLSHQVEQLAALVFAGGDAKQVASDLGMHPYGLQKMQPAARRLAVDDVKTMLAETITTDQQLKSTGIDPWLLVEKLVLKIAVN